MVSAVVPVLLQSWVPDVLFKNSLALGKLDTLVEVARIQRLKVTVDPDRITPVVPGTPDPVENC